MLTDLVSSTWRKSSRCVEAVYGFTGKRKGEAFRRKENNLLDLEGTLRQFDSDSDGKISFKEFLEQNRKHKLLLYPAFELQHNMRKAVMGDRYWRNREGPHFTEKDIVLHQLKKAMAPHQSASICLQATRNSMKMATEGGCGLTRDEEPSAKAASQDGTGEGVPKFVRTLSGQAQISWQWSHEARQAAVREEFEAQAVDVLLEQEEEGRASKEGHAEGVARRRHPRRHVASTGPRSTQIPQCVLVDRAADGGRHGGEPATR